MRLLIVYDLLKFLWLYRLSKFTNKENVRIELYIFR